MQTNDVKELLKDKNPYKFLASSQRFDYLPVKSRKHDPAAFYPLSFRIVRFPVSDTTCETIITNLDAELFPAAEIKKLYAMRWGIETSFRELKYPLALLHLHAKRWISRSALLPCLFSKNSTQLAFASLCAVFAVQMAVSLNC